MATASGLRQVGYFDCAGGGQVIVQNGIAFVGHMRSPHGTSIIDVCDPKSPKLMAELSMPPGTHSHKVRINGDVMVVNHEINGDETATWAGSDAAHARLLGTNDVAEGIAAFFERRPAHWTGS